MGLMDADGPYTPIKIHLTFGDQVALLQSRGMSIADPAAAIATLQRIGYYRLAGYWFTLRVAGRDDFIPGTTFALVEELCDFDRRLRLLVLDAVERVEVAIRVDVAYLLGKRHRLAHEQPALLDGNFCNRTDPAGRTEYDRWKQKLAETVAKSKDEFVTHHNIKYGGRMPIWVVTELWDFGLLSRFFSGMQYRDRSYIAQRYAAGDGTILSDWLRAINYARNVAAHHSRMWNRNIVYRPRLPGMQPHHLLYHLSNQPHSQTRIYGTLCILRYLVRTICPTDLWHQSLIALVNQFPQSPLVDIRQAGFLPNWQTHALWQ